MSGGDAASGGDTGTGADTGAGAGIGRQAQAVRGQELGWQCGGVLGGLLGYGCLTAFLALVAIQTYRWLKAGEWEHFGVTEALRAGLARCCVKDGDTGRLAALSHWIDTPVTWLGLHRVLEILPASLALFAISILGNSLFVYCRDRLDELRTRNLP